VNRRISNAGLKRESTSILTILNPYYKTVIKLIQDPNSAVLTVELSGKLHDADYKEFVPAVDAAVAAHGKVRMLVRFHDFHGWDLHALWDDTKFAAAHCTAIERLALVGEKKWEEWMAKVCKPFTMAKVKYFDASEADAAKAWVHESGSN
jgi:hypothetical protein